MHFTRISIRQKEVSLEWKTMVGTASITHELTTKEKALPAFAGALQAFQGFALAIMDAPATWEEQTRVTTLNFTEDKNGRRGLMISISKRVDRARGAASSITTPVMWEADDLEGEIADGFYGKMIDELIDTVEEQAAKFQAGEREQVEIFAKGEEQPAPKTVGKKSKKPRDFIPGVGPIANPDATEQPTDDNLRQLLLRAGRDVPVDAITRWGSGDRDQAQRWATEIITATLQQKKPRATCVEPACVKKDGTLPLIHDEKPAAAAI